MTLDQATLDLSVNTPGRVEHDGRSHKPEKGDYLLMYGNRRLTGERKSLFEVILANLKA